MKRTWIITLLLVVCLLTTTVGGTIAWFTDSVTSENNKIQAGNLDIALLMHNGTEYVDISDSRDPIFGTGSVAQNNNAETLWEPGKTQVVYLAVKNNGTLDLKYNIALNVVDEGLVGSLEYAVIDGANATDDPITATNWAELKAVAQTGDIAAGTTVAAPNGQIKAGEEADYFALAVHMKEEAGNEYQNKSVTIDMTVRATQLDSEEDSFDNQYDKEATYTITANSEATLDAALTNGGNIIIEGTITDTTMQAYSATTNVVTLLRPTKDTTLSGGKIIMDNSAANWGFVVDAKNNVNVTVKDTAIVGNNNWNMHNIVEPGSKLIIDNVDVSASGGSGIYVTGGGEAVINNATVAQDGLNPDAAPWAATAVATSTKSNVTINGGTYEGTTNAVYTYNSGATVTINGGTFKAPNVLRGDGNYSDGDDAVVATIIVNDGTFDGSIVANNGNALITINGGNFTNFAFNDGGWNKRGVLVIKGGTFDADPSKWVNTNAYNVTEANGLWTVTAK